MAWQPRTGAGKGRGQRARPRLCLRRRALGVLRLCVTLAGVRAGAGRGDGEGSGGRGFLLRSRPRPPAYWLGAAALWRARRETLGRERSSEKGQRAVRGPLPEPPRAPAFATPPPPAGRRLATPGQGPAPSPALPLPTGSASFQWTEASPADRCMAEYLPSHSLAGPQMSPAVLLGFNALGLWAFGKATSALWSSVFSSVKWGKYQSPQEMVSVKLGIGKAPPPPKNASSQCLGLLPLL